MRLPSFIILCIAITVIRTVELGEFADYQDERFHYFSKDERLRMREAARTMFQFGYDNYMRHAFPQDELNPIHCTGRGPDYSNRDNINVNDALGDYSLTLVDALDTLVIMGNTSEFKRAVQLVLQHVSFDKPNEVQVFEATIRVVGGLLSAHMLIVDDDKPFGDLVPDGYADELLHLANDLATRLLPAFYGTATGIPYPRVNLVHGVDLRCRHCINETCTAGAGSLILEFGLLSALLRDPVYYAAAKRALSALWQYRSNVTGLFGNVISIQSGRWLGLQSGVGAGLDSMFEYMLKGYILFGDTDLHHMFVESLSSLKFHTRRGRAQCNEGRGGPPIFVNVNMLDGSMVNNWVDSLSAAWPGVLALNGDIEDAICLHAMYYSIWRKYGALPERFNWHLKVPEVSFYPLRPELVESTYFLYQATKSPFYLHVGKDIIASLNNHTRAECGYATVHDVVTKELEDRMESFFLSETCKYLYLLFDEENHLNKAASQYVFSTEGHVFPVKRSLRQALSELADSLPEGLSSEASTSSAASCKQVSGIKQFGLPLQRDRLQEIEAAVGLSVVV